LNYYRKQETSLSYYCILSEMAMKLDYKLTKFQPHLDQTKNNLTPVITINKSYGLSTTDLKKITNRPIQKWPKKEKLPFIPRHPLLQNSEPDKQSPLLQPPRCKSMVSSQPNQPLFSQPLNPLESRQHT